MVYTVCKYHIEKIVYLVASDLWKHPIIICPDCSIEDGQHKYWAAKYLGESGN